MFVSAVKLIHYCYQDTRNPQADWESHERKAEDAKSKEIDKNHGYLVYLAEYLLRRIPSLSNYCVICDSAHIFANG